MVSSMFSQPVIMVVGTIFRLSSGIPDCQVSGSTMLSRMGEIIVGKRGKMQEIVHPHRLGVEHQNNLGGRWYYFWIRHRNRFGGRDNISFCYRRPPIRVVPPGLIRLSVTRIRFEPSASIT